MSRVLDRSRRARVAPAAVAAAEHASLPWLSRLIGGFPEIAWLYVAIAVPVVFSIALTRDFDLPKTAYLRATGTALLAVAIARYALGPWLVRREPAASVCHRTRLETAAVVAACAVVVAMVASTVLSVVPRISLAGSHMRNFGLFTEAINLVAFLAVVLALKRRRQLERLCDAVVVVAAIVAADGLSQAAGLDPLGAGFAVAQLAVFSTLGNSGFLGGFLVAAMAITGARILSTWPGQSGAAPDSDGRGFDVLVAACLGAVGLAALSLLGVDRAVPWWIMPALPLSCLAVLTADRRLAPDWWTPRWDRAVFSAILVAEAICLVLTRSRAAWLAFPAALLVFALAATGRRSVRLSVGLSAVAMATAIALVLVVTMRDTPLAGVRRLPGFERFVDLVGTRLSADARIAIWGDVLTLIRSGGYGAVDGDRFAALRPLVGYGPGTLYLVGERFASPRRFSVEVSRIDRAHNEYLDRLVSNGALGFAAWVSLTGAIAALGVASVRIAASTGVRWPAAAVVAALAGLLVNDLAGPGDPTSRLYYWILAGALTSPVLRRGRPSPTADLAGPAATGVTFDRPSRSHGIGVGSRWPQGARARLWGAAALALVFVLLTAVLAQVPPLESHTVVMAVTSAGVFVGLAALALSIGWPAPSSGSARGPARSARWARIDVLGTVALAALGAALFVRNVQPLEADLYNRLALLASEAGAKPAAADYARRAIAISPNEELYYMTLGGALADIAGVVPDRGAVLPAAMALDFALRRPLQEFGRLTRRDFLNMAEGAFQRARELNPYDSIHYQNLVSLYEVRMELGDAGAREQALTYAAQGLAVSPANTMLRTEYDRLRQANPGSGG